jgi:hypothetical protein
VPRVTLHLALDGTTYLRVFGELPEVLSCPKVTLPLVARRSILDDLGLKPAQGQRRTPPLNNAPTLAARARHAEVVGMADRTLPWGIPEALSRLTPRESL